MINTNDGLYLAGTWVADVEAALTFTANDLTKPDSLEFSYSNTFSLPDTLLIRDILENAEQLDAGGDHPYKQIPAYLIVEGEKVFQGIVELNSFQGGWRVNLMDSQVPFFDQLQDKKLSDLDLSRYNHPWTFNSINQFAGNDKGVVYPIIDYGGVDGGIMPYDTMTPAVYAQTIAAQIAYESGYRLAGDWLSDPLFLKLAVPFVEDEPKSHDEDWRNDRTARVTANRSDNLVLKSGSPIDTYLPLYYDNLPLDGFTDGAANAYKADQAMYVCTDNMYLNVQVSITFLSLTQYGAAELKLIVERNGMSAAEAYWSEAGYYDHLDEPGDSLTIDETIQCRKGDEIRIRLTGGSRTNFSKYSFYFLQGIGDMYAAFTPDTRIHFGDDWLVAQNLPDMSCSDFLVGIAKMMCGSYNVDAFRKTLTLIPFSTIIDNLPTALDWSTKVEESQEPIYTPAIEGYGQRNICQWKELDEKGTKRDKVSKLGFGDGVLICEAKNMPPEAVLFELPFAACANSEVTIPGYGTPILIKTRSIKGTADDRTIDTQSSTPRLILVEPTKTFSVTTKELTPEGLERKVSVLMTGCWWGERLQPIVTEDNGFCLAFDQLPNAREQWLIARYFLGLRRVLRRPRTLTVSTVLQAEDVSNLNPAIPIRLKQVRIGSLDISDNYFYLNKIQGYQSGSLAQCVLIVIS